MPRVAAWRPEKHQPCFQKGSSKHAWLNKFEVSLADATWSLDKHSTDLAHLHDIVDSKVPRYHAGPNLEEILADLMRLGGDGRAAQDATISGHSYPADQIVQLFPGAYIEVIPNCTSSNDPESLTLLIKVLTLKRS